MAKSKQASKPKFVNPFNAGVTYEQFLKSVPNGVTVSEHLKDKCTPEEISWIESELKQLKLK